MYKKELELRKKYDDISIGRCDKNILKFSSNSTFKFSRFISGNRGITLIALIITIIVMLILVGVTVNIVINGGLFANAKQAATGTQLEADKETLLTAVIGAINDSAEVDFDKLDKNLPEGFTVDDRTYTSKAGNVFYVDEKGNVITAVQVLFNGETVSLTPKNVGKYLGKIVTNYKKEYNATENITIGEEEYIVSTKYRLYYVDFENKYKDGAGTIYLKADCTSTTGYPIPKTDTTPSTADNIKIKNLNPELYKEGNPPNENNIKAVKWLTNTKNWESLKSNLNGINESDINYIVGAPSLEMMIDSYNTHYGLKEDIPDTSVLNEKSNRVKLFYKYPYDDKRHGYAVGPSNNESAQSGYYYYTSDFTVKKDEEIDNMYFPGEQQFYWLSSPSAFGPYVMHVLWYNGCYIGYYDPINERDTFCPLVSLKSSVRLTLK